jgi:RNA polymerase sigma-70 factor (ECF subfamily)
MPDSADQMSDHLLIASFKNEQLKEASFTQLVKKYQERLYWHIRRMVVEHEDTNDILQNVFIKVWKNLGEFRQESNFYTWLYRIGTNEALTWIEQKKRKSAVSMSDNEDIFADRLVAQKDFDPNKIEWKLQQAVLSLPEKQRIVFNLRYYDELPYEQMAEVLSTSVGALKASYHHAARKVEAFIKGD